MTRRARSSTAVIAELRRRLSAVLERHGFQSTGSPQFVEGRAFDRWNRASDWKRDIFEIDYRVRQPDSVGAKVIVKILPSTGREVTVDMASVAFLAGRGSDYQLRDTSPEELLRLIDEDIERAMPWFELYASPAKALERMRSATRNGCGRGTAPYEAALGFLSGLQTH
jgi:hypothetical protein